MNDNQISLWTGWDGCGTTSAYVFYREIGLYSSQWATAKTAAMAEGMKLNWDLDNLYRNVSGSLKQVHDESIPISNRFRGFSGWPYSLFYKQIDEDPDNDCKFIHAIKSTEGWAEHEIGFHWVKGVPLETFQEHAEYIYGSRLNNTSSIDVWQMWVNRFKKHNKDVLEYFSDKSDRFLLLDLDALLDNEKAEKICEFLEIPYTGQEYPSAQVSEWMNVRNQRLINGESYQDVWTTRKPNLNLS